MAKRLIDRLFPPSEVLYFVGATVRDWDMTDQRILDSHFKVAKIRATNLFQVCRHAIRTKVIYRMFVDALGVEAVVLAKLFGKKSLVICAGYDVDAVPEINYGLGYERPGQKILWPFRNWAIKNADWVGSSSDLLRRAALKLVDRDIEVCHSAMDTDLFHPPTDGTKRRNLVISVSAVDKTTWDRKGIRVFVEMAHRLAPRLPETEFVFIGRIEPEMAEQTAREQARAEAAGINLTFTGRISLEELVQYYQQAKVYVQYSVHEGFGISNGEAMASGCAVVAADRGALPEVVGDAGVIIAYGDEAALDREVERLIKDEAERDRLGALAATRIAEKFDFRRRERILAGAAYRLMGKLSPWDQGSGRKDDGAE